MASNKFTRWFKENYFVVLIISSAIIGLISGLIIQNVWPDINPQILTLIGLPGNLIIRAFTMIVVPLIVFSLANSISGSESSEDKRAMRLTFILFASFTTYATILGSVLMHLIRPGVRPEQVINIISNESLAVDSQVNALTPSKEDAIYDLLINLIPDNIITAAFMTHYTALEPINAQNISFGLKKSAKSSFQTNYLGLCTFSLILGFSVLSLGEKAAKIKALIEETNDIIMEMVKALIKFTPIAMLSWMCLEGMKMQSPEKVIGLIFWFFLTTMLGFFLHLIVIMSGLYLLIVHKNPFRFYANIFPAILLAFGSSSSALTLPVTIESMEKRNKTPESVTRFVLPLGMNLNMNGLALYYTMVVLFVAQMHGLTIDIQQNIALCLFVVIISVTIPAVPSGSAAIVTFMIACGIVGIDNPLDILAYLMPIDWLMSRMRTATNVIGDCFVAAFVHKLTKHSLHENNIYIDIRVENDSLNEFEEELRTLKYIDEI